MRIQEVKIGTRLELEIINREGLKIGLTYISQLLEISNSESIIISCPIYESKYVFIALGTNVRIAFFNERISSLFFFTGVISHKENKDHILLLHININSELQKLQRRNYFRFDCNLAARYRIIPELKSTETTAENSVLPEFKTALTRNLSGSGASIVVEEAPIKGSSVEVDIFLSEKLPVKAKCKIVRITEIPARKGKNYEVGLYFLELSKKDQDDVVKFIFERQREVLKKHVTDK